MKKISKFFFVFAFIIPSIWVMVAASTPSIIASGYCGGEGDGTNLSWSLNNEGLLAIGGSGAMADYTSISPWYGYRSSISSVVVGENVTTIGENAFNSLVNLATVILPNGVTSIGEQAFYNCKELTSVNIPAGVTTIVARTFSGCNELASITIPESVTRIKNYAFAICGVTEITFTGQAPVIEGSAFVDVRANAYYPADDTSWTEDIFNKSYGGYLTWIPVSFSGPVGTITDTGRSISLEGEVFINQYVTVEGFEGVDVAEQGGLLIWNSEVTEDAAVYGTADVTQAGLIAFGDEYTQRTTGIAAKEYADEVWLRVYVDVGYGEFIYGPLVEYSVQDYCEHKIGNNAYSDTVQDTCAALLHYGTMAQRMFKYNTGDLANANILELYPAPEWMN